MANTGGPLKCCERTYDQVPESNKERSVPLEDKISDFPPCQAGDEAEPPCDACFGQSVGCGRPNMPGKPLFVSHPNVHLASRPDCYTMGLKVIMLLLAVVAILMGTTIVISHFHHPHYHHFLSGYGRPPQHPLYITSNATYGRHQAPPALNSKKFPRRGKFTNYLSKSGPYQDNHFTTGMETDFVYRPTAD